MFLVGHHMAETRGGCLLGGRCMAETRGECSLLDAVRAAKTHAAVAPPCTSCGRSFGERRITEAHNGCPLAEAARQNVCNAFLPTNTCNECVTAESPAGNSLRQNTASPKAAPGISREPLVHFMSGTALQFPAYTQYSFAAVFASAAVRYAFIYICFTPYAAYTSVAEPEATPAGAYAPRSR